MASSSSDTIHLTVRLFSVLRHREGKIVDRLELDVASGSRTGDVLRLLEVKENLKAILSINDEMVGEDALLADGDVLSIIPQVAGG